MSATLLKAHAIFEVPFFLRGMHSCMSENLSYSIYKAYFGLAAPPIVFAHHSLTGSRNFIQPIFLWRLIHLTTHLLKLVGQIRNSFILAYGTCSALAPTHPLQNGQ